ncbi:hypothetical protein GDO81_022332 [Engystomops pustulosus]|uniref:Uncharacterized protein n=1 Tax=Engystomops pustulosus TaxID=76066 RepID=A0AAV6Z4M3_ENGPU|nr:hypothetical protein GDO81_022332 [Engystomops pustulosus]
MSQPLIQLSLKQTSSCKGFRVLLESRSSQIRRLPVQRSLQGFWLQVWHLHHIHLSFCCCILQQPPSLLAACSSSLMSCDVEYWVPSVYLATCWSAPELTGKTESREAPPAGKSWSRTRFKGLFILLHCNT